MFLSLTIVQQGDKIELNIIAKIKINFLNIILCPSLTDYIHKVIINVIKNCQIN